MHMPCTTAMCSCLPIVVQPSACVCGLAWQLHDNEATQPTGNEDFQPSCGLACYMLTLPETFIQTPADACTVHALRE